MTSTANSISPTTEVWVRTNRRALLVAACAASFVLTIGISLVWIAGQTPAPLTCRVVGGTVIGLSLLLILSLLYQMTLPRVAYRDRHLLVYLHSSEPIAVPIDVVELFFMGQGASHIATSEAAPSRSRTIVARLALSATDWHARETKPAWGEWRDAYIIVRGTWCEPITPELLKQLNRRLGEIHRERRSTAAATTP